MSTEYIERGAEPKPHYIDINAFLASENVNNVYGDYWELKEKLEELPAADVEPVKRGKWEHNSSRPDRFICSECGAGYDMMRFCDGELKFCPNCGARMKKCWEELPGVE